MRFYVDDEENWYFLLFEGGEGAAQINDGVMTITTEKEGTVDISGMSGLKSWSSLAINMKFKIDM